MNFFYSFGKHGFPFSISTQHSVRNQLEKSVGIHKVFLADISPVFKGMLFGLLKETGEEIEVKETFPEVLISMLGYV